MRPSDVLPAKNLLTPFVCFDDGRGSQDAEGEKDGSCNDNHDFSPERCRTIMTQQTRPLNEITALT